MRTRVEFSWFKETSETSKGTLIFQDVIFKPLEKPYSFTARMALFDTNDFDSRIYAYENSLLYEFAIPSFSDRGVRYYLNYRHDIFDFLTAEFRIARTLKSRGDIGSGNDFIDGDSRTDIKAQLKFSF